MTIAIHIWFIPVFLAILAPILISFAVRSAGGGNYMDAGIVLGLSIVAWILIAMFCGVFWLGSMFGARLGNHSSTTDPATIVIIAGRNGTNEFTSPT
jgi:hypothetical protein